MPPYGTHFAGSIQIMKPAAGSSIWVLLLACDIRFRMSTNGSPGFATAVCRPTLSLSDVLLAHFTHGC